MGKDLPLKTIGQVGARRWGRQEKPKLAGRKMLHHKIKVDLEAVEVN
jgi:hypothetical protein